MTFLAILLAFIFLSKNIALMERHLFSKFNSFHSETKKSVVSGSVWRLIIFSALAFLGTNTHLHAQCQTCCNGSKPKTLVMKYVGGNCSATQTCQAAGKWSCTGNGPNNAATVYITASKNADGSGGTYFAGTVNLNSQFTVNSAAGGSSTFPSNTYFNIYSSQGGTLLQRVQNHTSCSTPLVAGDQLGALVMMQIILADNTTCNAPTPPPPPETCPTPAITINNTTPTNVGPVCKGDQVTFKTTDQGFPCLAYLWNFGNNASPQTATGIGPHTVTYSASGTATVSLRIDNNCEGGTGSTICTNPPGHNGQTCFKVDPPTSGSNSGISYTVTTQNGQPYSVTVTGSGISSVEVKGGPVSKIYSTPPFTNLTAPVNPSTGQPYAISNFVICRSSSTSSGGADCCDSNSGKPKSLTLQYTGQSCSASNTSQSTSKYSCSDSGGGPNNAASVYIVANEKEDGSGVTYFSGTVNLNSTFTATSPGSSLPTNTYFRISASQNGQLLQTVKIHTSCSAPIVPGDQFGSLKLLGATWATGATCGSVTPPGPNCVDCDKTVTATVTIQDCTPVLGKIGDFVWLDANGNGIQDAGEQGIPNAFVMLMTCTGTFVTSTTTDANGMYMFPNLPAGSYKVFFANPNGSLYMPALQDQGGDDTKDSDAAGNGFTACVTIAQGQTNLTVDAGFKPLGPPPCSISINVTNIVCDGKGTPSTADDTYTFTFTVTGTNISSQWQGGYDNAYLGAFAFGPTAYNTPITLGPFPAGQFTPSNVFPPITFQNGVDINLYVNDVVIPSCSASKTVLSPGPCSPGAPASLGDFVWNDLNNNGAQDFGEPGVSGVTVRLYKCDNSLVSTTTTNANGFYQFTNLVANMQYYVEFVKPNGYVFSPKDAVADNIDSDADLTTGKTACVLLAPGENNTTLDAGVYQPTPVVGSIGDFVWNDLNQNGIQDAGEPGLAGVTVRLRNCSNAVLAVTTTNAAGFYNFPNLAAGCYRVSVDILSGYVFSPQDQGGDNSKDSDVNSTTGITADINLGSGQNDPTWDAGLYLPPQPTGSIGDFVWNDLNQNGIQDAGEPGVQGVLVKLFRCDNTFIGQFTTTATGFYQFVNLPAASYYVQFSNLPAGYVFTTPDAGIDDTKDSDVNPATGNTICFPLATGQNDPTRDAGIKQTGGTGPATIGDFVWFDTNGNGIQEPGEPGIPNVFVILETCAGAYVNFAVTNAQGLYLFTNVQPGQYRIKFANPGSYNGFPIQLTLKDAGNDDSKDSDADWLGFTNCFSIAAGETNLTLDAGFKGEGPPPICVINGSVSNIVCNDKGTPNNPGDDTYTFTLIVNGSNVGDWGYDIPALNLYTLQYGQPYNLGPFNISAGTLTLYLNDHDVNGCTTTVTVQPPAPCSSGPVLPSLTINDVTVNENAGNAILQICASSPATSNITVQYITSNGSAVSGSDYVTKTGTATITTGNTCTTISIQIIDDNVSEPTETFNVFLSNPTGATIADNQGVVTILDNDQPAPCNNVTNGGTIGYDETQCVPFDPANIVSLTLPSGGSGALEYVWLSSTTGCPDNINQAIPNTNSPTYNPPFISQTTWYIRCARRVGCTEWIESNCIKKEVCNTGGGCNVTITGGSVITISGLNAPNVNVKVFNSAWQQVFSCLNNCSNPQVVGGLPAGTYYVDVQMWNANWQPVCNKSQYVTITNFTGGNSGGINLVGTPDTGQEETQAELVDRNNESVTSQPVVKAPEIRLYPNPANNFVNLDLGSLMGKEVRIELLDNLGRNIRHIEIDEVQTDLHRIDLDNLKEGYYMVWVKTPGQPPVAKQFIVARQ